MLARKAYQSLQAWGESASKKALLVKGARQVGKSFLVEAFSREAFENVVIFDLVDDVAARGSFNQAVSAEDLLLRMSVVARTPLVPPQDRRCH